MTAERTRMVPGWTGTASLALSMLAVALTTYLTVTHYTDPAALACPDTGIVNCTLVTTSSWSEVFGVPVALVGLVWAVAMAAACSPWGWRSGARWVAALRMVLATAGAVTVVYLVYVELFRVDAICLWCTGVHVTAVALFGVILVAHAASRDRTAGSVQPRHST
jgi:uncharacterized membrane protein